MVTRGKDLGEGGKEEGPAPWVETSWLSCYFSLYSVLSEFLRPRPYLASPAPW
jgi:hypothetical protein